MMHKDKSLTRLLMVIAMLLAANGTKAQIGEHRDDLSIGGNAGVSLSSNKIEAIRRIWNLYRNVEGLGVIYSAYCFVFWAVRAVARRM